MITVANVASPTPNVLSLHHDLWVELARIEMAMEKLDGLPDGAAGKRHQLEQRRVRLHHAMERLPE